MTSVAHTARAIPLLCFWKHSIITYGGEADVSFRPPKPLIFTICPLQWHMYVFKTTREIVPHMEIKCNVVVWSDDVVGSLGEAESAGSQLHTCSLHVQMERKTTELLPNCCCRVRSRWFPLVLFLFFPLIQYWPVQSVLRNTGNLLGKSFKVITRLALSNAKGNIRIPGWSSEAWLTLEGDFLMNWQLCDPE